MLWLGHRSRLAADLHRFGRFAIVGVFQNAVNVGAFAAAVAGGVPFLLAFVLAACVALTVSFALNRAWTFPGTTDRTATRALRFGAIWVTMLLLGLPTLAGLVDIAHLPRVLAQTLIIVAGAPLSYLAQRRWTFA